VSLKDPNLPFVVVHNEITLRPRCFVRLPIRFVPTNRRMSGTASSTATYIKSYSGVLVACSSDGSMMGSVELVGSSYYGSVM
jgi:hypothetical protein